MKQYKKYRTFQNKEIKFYCVVGECTKTKKQLDNKETTKIAAKYRNEGNTTEKPNGFATWKKI